MQEVHKNRKDFLYNKNNILIFFLEAQKAPLRKSRECAEGRNALQQLLFNSPIYPVPNAHSCEHRGQYHLYTFPNTALFQEQPFHQEPLHILF